MKFLVRFDDGKVTMFKAESFSEEGSLTYFYDEDDKLVGAIVTAKAFAIQTFVAEVAKSGEGE